MADIPQGVGEATICRLACLLVTEFSQKALGDQTPGPTKAQDCLSQIQRICFMLLFLSSRPQLYTCCLLTSFRYCLRGFTSLGQAVEDALAALAACRAPAQSSAPQLQIARGGMRHLPDFEGWRDTMTSVHSSLSASSSVVQVIMVSLLTR